MIIDNNFEIWQKNDDDEKNKDLNGLKKILTIGEKIIIVIRCSLFFVKKFLVQFANLN